MPSCVLQSCSAQGRIDTLAGASSLSQESGAPRVPARPQVVQEVDKAALTRATRRCWNLLFLRRRREQRRSFPWWRAGRRIFRFCSAAAGCAPLAHPDLVSRTHFPRDSTSLAHSSEEGPPFSGARHHMAPASRSMEPPCVAPGRDAAECLVSAPLLPLVEGREENLPFLFRRWSKGQLRDSVRQATSQVQRRSRDVGGSPECPCLARGDCCPPGKRRNLAGPSSREEAGVLQPLLHRTQEMWWPSTNPGSASFELGKLYTSSRSRCGRAGALSNASSPRIGLQRST